MNIVVTIIAVAGAAISIFCAWQTYRNYKRLEAYEARKAIANDPIPPRPAP